MIQATFRKLDGPRIDGGWVLQFDVPGSELTAMIELVKEMEGKPLNLWVEVIDIYGEPKKPVADRRKKMLAYTQVLINKMGWDDDAKKAYLMECFEVDSRSKLNDDQLSALIDRLLELTGEKPNHEEYS